MIGSRRWGLRLRWQACVIGSLLAVVACSDGPSDLPAVTAGHSPRLPAGKAGEVLARAIDAAGGWKEWRKIRDVSFISTLTIFDVRGDATSETIFLHKQPLHQGPVSRLESIGLKTEVIFGYDGSDSWMRVGGRWVEQPQEKMFTEFHGVSSTLSFGVPFVLAEFQGLSLEYAGEETDEEQRWEKLRLTYPESFRSPIEWAVLYFDRRTGLLDRVLAQVNAPFFEHPIWLGRWREYRRVGGVLLERVRSFYPADAAGNPVSGLAAEQLIEHLQFDHSFPPELFRAPLRAKKGTITLRTETAPGRNRAS